MAKYVFNSIGVIGKHNGASVSETLNALIADLQQRGLQVLLDRESAELTPDINIETVGRQEIGQRCDLAIVVGGDGTLLNAARELADSGTPLLGVNLGRLGFLADILPSTMHKYLDEILRGDYLLEERFLLHCHIQRNQQLLDQSYALNEVVIHKWNVARMIELETYIDGRFIHRQRADGLIIATPTGSTAYALSAGGPIIYPTLNAMTIVPVCPHTMSNRPIVVDGDSQIEVIVCDSNSENIRVTCDGQVPFQLTTGDRVRVHKAAKPLHLIHPSRHDHYDMLRAKLQWAEPPKGGRGYSS